MPIPVSFQSTELILSSPVDPGKAMENALIASGALAQVKEEVKSALQENGLTIPFLVGQLAGLIVNAKDNVKHAAIRDAFQLNDVQLKTDGQIDSKPTFVFNVQAENAQLNSLFAPERG